MGCGVSVDVDNESKSSSGEGGGLGSIDDGDGPRAPHDMVMMINGVTYRRQRLIAGICTSAQCPQHGHFSSQSPLASAMDDDDGDSSDTTATT